MKRALIPGSYDPITLGHLEIIKRASNIMDEVIVCVAKSEKKHTMLDLNQRLSLVKESIKNISNAKAIEFDGLLVDVASKYDAKFLIKGLRNNTDFNYEYPMFVTNKQLNNDLDTIFLMSSPQYLHVSSSLVRELYSFGGNFKTYVPECVYKLLT